MSCGDRSDWLDLERTFLATREDVLALRRTSATPMTPDQYLAWLRFFEPKDTQTLRDRPGPRGEPFRLP